MGHHREQEIPGDKTSSQTANADISHFHHHHHHHRLAQWHYKIIHSPDAAAITSFCMTPNQLLRTDTRRASDPQRPPCSRPHAAPSPPTSAPTSGEDGHRQAAAVPASLESERPCILQPNLPVVGAPRAQMPVCRGRGWIRKQARQVPTLQQTAGTWSPLAAPEMNSAATAT